MPDPTAIDPAAVKAGLTTAEAVWTSLASMGAWETVRSLVLWVRKRRQDKRDTEAKRLQDASDAGAARVEQSRDNRKDAMDEVWHLAQERQHEVERLTTQGDSYRKDCHERLNHAQTQINGLHAARIEDQKKIAMLEGRVSECERRWAEVTDLQGRMTKVEDDTRA